MTPTRREVEALMKRCQIGVGGRNALDNAHSIMAACYGTLGALMLRVEELESFKNRHTLTVDPACFEPGGIFEPRGKE